MLDLARMEKLVDSFERVHLLVVGDFVLDSYVWGDVDRVSPEAPVPGVRVQEETEVLGGAANVVRNVVALGGKASFCSAVGSDAAGRRVAEMLSELGVDPAGLVSVEGRPTTRKTRIVARNQQLVRFDHESILPLPDAAARSLLAAVERAIPASDGAIVEDYGKGVLGEPFARSLMRAFAAAELPAAVDPKADLSPYRGAALLKPNLREAEVLSGVRITGPGDLARAVERLRKQVGEGLIAVTRGAEGMTLFEGEGAESGVEVATVAQEVFDVQGAGDTAIAGLVLSLRAGASPIEAAVIANAASGVVVGKVGTATANAAEVRGLLPAALLAAGAAGEAGS